jgi:hypothetical protein
MPALDTSAGEIALGQLQALPFGNIIGGPLTAAIDAQALAAQTTVNFIKAIGFEDVNGQLQTVTLVFTYEAANGAFSRISVPLLLVIPIPFIVIETVDIQFKARIAATAEQSSTTTTGTTFTGNLTHTNSVNFRWRRWLRASETTTMSGTISTKKDSTASQQSKYSVEYTMDVQVHATQAGIPQGMAAILNILQDSISHQPHSTRITIYSLGPLLVGNSGNTAFSDTGFNLLVVDADGEPTLNTTTVSLTSANGLVAAVPAATAAGLGVYTVALAPVTAAVSALAAGVDAPETLQITVTTAGTPPEVTTLVRDVTVRKG